MSTLEEKRKCPQCDLESINVSYYERRGGGFTASSSPCSECGFQILGALVSASNVADVRENVAKAPGILQAVAVGLEASWPVNGIRQEGVILAQLAPNEDIRDSDVQSKCGFSLGERTKYQGRFKTKVATFIIHNAPSNKFFRVPVNLVHIHGLNKASAQ